MSGSRSLRVLLAVVLVTSLGVAAGAGRGKKKCKRLCKSTIGACVTQSCAQLPKKKRGKCKTSCKRTTVAACKQDQDRTRCTAALPPVRAILAVHGRVVRIEDGASAAQAIPDAEVRIGVDRDGNGSLGAAEIATAATDPGGAYRLEVPVTLGDAAVVSFRATGLAPLIRRVNGGPGADLLLNAALRDLQVLDCNGVPGQCLLADEKLSILGLTVPLHGQARLFDPSRDADAFPGSYRDAQGNVLRPSVFSVVQLTDDAGTPVHDLSPPATLCMDVPRDTRSLLADLTPGTGVIEVPFYAFDEVAGTWVRDGAGTLQDGSGHDLAESRLPDIRSGAFAGPVVACGLIAHFSWWSVAVPMEGIACAGMTVRAPGGGPAEGATVYLTGVTYLGISDLQTADGAGSACTAVPRSEGVGEDIDGDGTPGETHRSRVRVLYGGTAYDGGEIVSAGHAGTCPCAGPEIALSAANELGSNLCRLTGRVVDEAGTASAGATVVAFDPAVPTEALEQVCGLGGCSFVGVSASDGSFALALPFLQAIEMFAYGYDATFEHARVGELSLSDCPTAPIELQIEPTTAP
ncbi:MAG: hypothetical protein U0807_18525 [Candidatus Binatia bacterium]